MRRMRRQVKTLRTYLGRVVRDIERTVANLSELQAIFGRPRLIVKIREIQARLVYTLLSIALCSYNYK